MAHDVFVSYSSIDKPVADAVCAMLERNQIRCWIAPRDVLPGSSYGEAIIEAINGSRVMVLVFSSASNASNQVMREVERAVSKEVPVIPLRIADVTPTKSMEYFLSAPHWLDALTPPIEEHLKRLSEVVHSIVKIEPRRDLAEMSKVDNEATNEKTATRSKAEFNQKWTPARSRRMKYVTGSIIAITLFCVSGYLSPTYTSFLYRRDVTTTPLSTAESDRLDNYPETDSSKTRMGSAIGFIDSLKDNQKLGNGMALVHFVTRFSLPNGSILEKKFTQGSGFAVTSTGYFLTCKHVVDAHIAGRKYQPSELGFSELEGTGTVLEMRVVVFIQGVRFDAKVVHLSKNFDVAMLKIEPAEPISFFRLSASDKHQLMTEVVALGFPSFEIKVDEFDNVPVESQFEKALQGKALVALENQLPKSAFGFIATRGAINNISTDSTGTIAYHSANLFKESSGGPLVNSDGLVLGINNFFIEDDSVKLNRSFFINDFRDELEEHFPGMLTWK